MLNKTKNSVRSQVLSFAIFIIIIHRHYLQQLGLYPKYSGIPWCYVSVLFCNTEKERRRKVGRDCEINIFISDI